MADCTYSVPDMDFSGDNFYGPYCNQGYIDWFWSYYRFEGNKKFWDDGFGWHDPCNSTKPLARTFNACYLLSYSAEDWAYSEYDAPQNILQWGSRYVHDYINELESKCGSGKYNAYAKWGPCLNDRTELYLGFWYNKSVVERASILIHEARHHHRKKDHQGKNKNDKNWDEKGPYAYEVAYLYWFVVEGVRTDPDGFMKDRARDRGNVLLDNKFDEHPGFNIP